MKIWNLLIDSIARYTLLWLRKQGLQCMMSTNSLIELQNSWSISSDWESTRNTKSNTCKISQTLKYMSLSRTPQISGIGNNKAQPLMWGTKGAVGPAGLSQRRKMSKASIGWRPKHLLTTLSSSSLTVIRWTLVVGEDGRIWLSTGSPIMEELWPWRTTRPGPTTAVLASLTHLKPKCRSKGTWTSQRTRPSSKTPYIRWVPFRFCWISQASRTIRAEWLPLDGAVPGLITPFFWLGTGSRVATTGWSRIPGAANGGRTVIWCSREARTSAVSPSGPPQRCCSDPPANQYCQRFLGISLFNI